MDTILDILAPTFCINFALIELMALSRQNKTLASQRWKGWLASVESGNFKDHLRRLIN